MACASASITSAMRLFHAGHLLADRAARRKRHWPAAAACRWWRCRHPPRAGCSCAPPPRFSMARSAAGGISRVGHHEAERGGHLRLDHAGAFGHARRCAPCRGAASPRPKAVLGTRSVVMMARATSSKPFGAQPRDQARQGVDDLAARPVPRRSRRWRPAAPARPAAAAVWRRLWQVASATASPVRVAQLALPALTRMAPTSPRERFRWRRLSFTGAACTRFCVNTAAAVAGRPLTISARSSFSAWRMPA